MSWIWKDTKGVGMWFRRRLQGIDIDITIQVKASHGWSVTPEARNDIYEALSDALAKSRKPGKAADLGLQKLFDNLTGLVRRRIVHLTSRGEITRLEQSAPEYGAGQDDRPVDVDLRANPQD